MLLFLLQLQLPAAINQTQKHPFWYSLTNAPLVALVWVVITGKQHSFGLFDTTTQPHRQPSWVWSVRESKPNTFRGCWLSQEQQTRRTLMLGRGVGQNKQSQIHPLVLSVVARSSNHMHPLGAVIHKNKHPFGVGCDSRQQTPPFWVVFLLYPRQTNTLAGGIFSRAKTITNQIS